MTFDPINRPLPWLFLVALALLALFWGGDSLSDWWTARKANTQLTELQDKLSTSQLALQATGAALQSERLATAKLQGALNQERQALQDAEKRRQALNAAYTAQLAKQEALEDADPQVKGWADQPVPAGIDRLLGDSRAHYRDQDRGGDALGTGGPDDADGDPGAQPPD